MGLGHARLEQMPGLVSKHKVVRRHGSLGHPMIPASSDVSDKLSDNPCGPGRRLADSGGC